MIGAVEIDAFAVETYNANHGEVKVWPEDIRGLTPERVLCDLRIEKGELDLLAGCPPCQGFSSIRTLNGKHTIEDERNDLVSIFTQFVEALNPRAIMLENVPGLLKDFRFTAFQNRLRELGYVGEARVLDAADYGVPQRRRRLIYMAGLGKAIDFAEAVKHKITVREALKGLPDAGESGDPIHDLPEKHSDHVQALIENIPKDGGSRKDLPSEYQLKCHQRSDGFKDVYGRMAWDKVAPTITSGCFNPSKGRFLHPEKNRAITMREAALLQGFPLHYKFLSNRGKISIAQLIGNALPPHFISSHAQKVIQYIWNENEPTPIIQNRATSERNTAYPKGR